VVCRNSGNRVIAGLGPDLNAFGLVPIIVARFLIAGLDHSTRDPRSTLGRAQLQVVKNLSKLWLIVDTQQTAKKATKGGLSLSGTTSSSTGSHGWLWLAVNRLRIASFQLLGRNRV
jgi:hypothetical protein